MKKTAQKSISLVLSLAMVFGVFVTLPGTVAQALANHVVINEVYGGGGNSGATYKNDFIELYNPTDGDLSLDGWSVQYASATGSTYQKTDLTGAIKAGGYYLIQEKAGSGGDLDLSDPDATGSIDLSGTKGKVALVNNSTQLSGASISDKASFGVIDYVGFGTAGDYETASAPAPSNTTSVARKTAGEDTDDNSEDFQAGAPTPQNSSSSDSPQDSGVVFTPSTAPDANGFVPSGTTVELSGAENGDEIHYQLNGSSEQTYQSPIVITETTTIKAWFVKNSQPQTPFYTVTYQVDNTVISNIGDARNAGSGKSATLTGVALHSYISTASGLGLYIQDDTGGIMLFGDSVLKNAGVQPGDTVEATGKTSLYSNKFELDLSAASVKSTPGSVPAAKETKIADIGESIGGMLIKISGAAVSALAEDSYHNASFTLTQDGKTLNAKLDSRRGDDYSEVAARVKNGQTADVTGILEGYKGNYTLQLLSADAVENVQDIPVAPKVQAVAATPGSNAAAKIGDQITLSCPTPGAVIHYTLDPVASDDQYLPYQSGQKITLSTLPTTITAFATADNSTQSDKSTFTYQEQYQGKYNIYFGQLHSHTNISDGVGDIGEAYDHASKVKNLDFLAVTDHSNYFETADEAKAHANTILDGSKSSDWKKGHDAADAINSEKVANSDNPDDPASTFLGVYGYEMTWSDGSGHINTFNTPGFEDRQNPFFNNKTQSASNPIGLKNYYDTLTQVPQSISQFNHPGTTFGDFYDFANYSPTYDKLIGLVEVGNGEGPVRGVGYFPSYEYYTRALDKGWHVAPTNNQDNHKGNWGDSNTARSVILAPSLTEANLYDALKNRRVYATEDNDLSIRYTVDDAVMGSELSIAKGENLSVQAELSDPTDAKIGKVEVIVNGGRVAATQQVDSNNDTVTFTVPNNYSYYYLRITEPDQDIAVTAPVWTGSVDKAGIASVSADTTLPVKGENFNITTSLFNNETSDLTVDSLEYKIGDTVLKTVSGGELDGGATIASLGTKNNTFSYVPDKAGSITINVVMKATQGGVERTYTNVLTIQVADPSTVTKVLIDGTHFNDYVTGYYSQSMGNITKIAADDGTQVRIETKAITPEMLKNTQLLVISAPAKSDGTSKAGDTYTAQEFSSDFIQMVKDYVKSGGTVAVCGLSDYTDGKNDPYTSSTQINTLLSGIGAKSTISSDEVVDQATNGGQSYRLYFQNYNMDSPYLKGVDPKQQYSFYSGCSVNPGEGAQWLVKGFDTTYSINSKMTDGKYESGVPATSATAPYNAENAVKKQGDVCALAQEDVGLGHVLIAGTVFLSDFEVKADVDNNWDLPYANKTIAQNLLDSVKVDIPATSIAEVRRDGQMGDVYEVEGTVTAGSELPNAFTDTVYLQDATGGINIYPIANGSGIKVGQKFRVIGHVDEYQGDKELKVGSGVERYEVIDTAINPVSPAVLSVADTLNYAENGGRLVKVTGAVSKIQALSGVIQSFALTSGSSSIRILINGYINPNVDLSNVVKDGASVSAVGLVYTDPDGVCLRVRDRNEITLTGSQSQDGGGHGGKSNDSPTPAKTEQGSATVTTGQENGKTIQTIETKPVGTPVITGGRSSVTVSVPAEAAAIVQNATPQAPAVVRITPPTADMLAQLGNPSVRAVDLTIQVPSLVANNTNPNASVQISLPAEVLSAAREDQKDVVLTVTDTQSGREVYSWSFSGIRSSQSVTPVTGVNLALTVAPVAGNTSAAAAAAGRASHSANTGILIGFAHSGLLPVPANVRVYLGGQSGVRPGSRMYLYYINSNIDSLEQIGQSAYPVDSEGYVTLTVVHCSDYLLLPEKATDSYPVLSDTTFPLGLRLGKSYTFSMTADGKEEPNFTVGNGKAFRVATVRKSGKYLVTVQAIGETGKTTALYSALPGKKPTVMCYLTVQ